jgi:hypothetical protein
MENDLLYRKRKEQDTINELYEVKQRLIYTYLESLLILPTYQRRSKNHYPENYPISISNTQIQPLISIALK